MPIDPTKLAALISLSFTRKPPVAEIPEVRLPAIDLDKALERSRDWVSRSVINDDDDVLDLQVID